MPLEPVTDCYEPGYPTLAEVAHRRRDFLRRVGLAAIAAAFGPQAGCSKGRGREGDSAHGGSGDSAQPDPATDPVPLAGVPAPPRWPGPRGAIVGGGAISLRYADGVRGWVAVAAVFDPSDQLLESALLAAQGQIAEIVRERVGRERSGFLADEQRAIGAEADLLEAIRAAVGVEGLDAIALSELSAEAARAERGQAPPPAAATRGAEPPAPALMMPAPAATGAPPPPAAAAAPAQRLPRAGARCPIHPNGCRRSEERGD